MRGDTFYDSILRLVPILTTDEEHQLTRRYAAIGDPKDADHLVLANLRLVFSICTELAARGRADFMDLVQEGSAGLVEAVKRFDPGRGVKLATYARWWIRAYVLRHLMETSHIVDPGSTREGRRTFFARSLPPDLSLDAPVRARGDEGGAAVSSILATMVADDATRPDVWAEAQEPAACLREALAAMRPTLNAREQAILERRLLSPQPERLADVGRRLRVSGERVRQLEAELVDRLRGAVARRWGEPLQAAA
jgi:RNA polymerase sigma-32 factor